MEVSNQNQINEWEGTYRDIDHTKDAFVDVNDQARGITKKHEMHFVLPKHHVVYIFTRVSPTKTNTNKKRRGM